MISDQDKVRIAERVLGIQGPATTKAGIAREYGVSPRTIGRIVTKFKEETKQEAQVPPVKETTSEYRFVASDESITVSRYDSDGTSTTEMIVKSDERYDSVFALVFDFHTSGNQESIEEAFRLMSIPEAIRHYSHGRIEANVDTGQLSYLNENGDTRYLSGKLVTRVMEALNDRNSSRLENLMAFSDRLIDNPSYEAIERLYDFIEHADIEINEDGMLICFKKVKGDFTDVRTGTFDNSPGSLVQEPRNEVNPDNKITCAKGLHVCAKHYLSHYPGDRVIRCKVNPADVVAIPYDYNNSKMRTCGYYVLDEVV